MTRETKIGLLVGLAFIIVIGILLSEHVSSTNEPQQAPLNTAGGNVRDGVVTPGAADDAPPISIAGAPVEAPRQPVPTNLDLHPPAPPVAFVPPGRAAPLAAGLDGATPRDLVQQHPDVLTYDPNRSPSSAGPGQAASGNPARQTPAPAPTTYLAVAGDSVSRIAARLMGGSNKANRDLLIRANPTLQNDGNVVVIGRTYVIPTDPSKVSQSAAGVAQQPPPHGPPAGDPAARPAEPTRWYTVKGDDNLWRIAQSQLGSGTAWTQIRDLNKDVLKGGETVHLNMRLRLPAKTAVAGAD